MIIVEKPSDSEPPTEERIATLCVAEENMYDVFFSVRFKGGTRTAQILLRHQLTGEELGTPNVAYRLKDDELEALLYEAGFVSFERIDGGANSHFPPWIAKT